MNIYPFSRFLRTPRGFTLIELMFALSIMAILMTLAVPSFSGAFASNRLTSSTNELFTAINQAKSEAVKLGRRVTICASANGAQCSDNINGWSSGWITVVDSTRSGSVTPSVDTGETVIALGQAVHDDVIIKGDTSFLSFSADGRSRDMGGGFLIAEVRVCSTSNSLQDTTRFRQITTGVAGRLTVKRPKDLPSGSNSYPSTCPDV